MKEELIDKIAIQWMVVTLDDPSRLTSVLTNEKYKHESAAVSISVAAYDFAASFLNGREIAKSQIPQFFNSELTKK